MIFNEDECNRLVNGVAKKFIYHRYIEYSEIISVGYEAYWKAFKSFKDNKGAKFPTWAILKVRGAILDALKAHRRKHFSLDIEIIESVPDWHNNSINKVEAERLLNTLEGKEKYIMNLYYIKGYEQKEIAKKLKVSDSRICQIHTRALKELRNNNIL